MTNPPSLTQLEMSEEDIEFAEQIAKKLGFTQAAYTSCSQLWGLFCLPDRASQKGGCIIKTKELGQQRHPGAFRRIISSSFRPGSILKPTRRSHGKTYEI